MIQSLARTWRLCRVQRYEPVQPHRAGRARWRTS